MTDLAVRNGHSPGVLLDEARQALERAATVDEVKDIRDKAEALRLYTRQAGLGLEMQNRCAEIKLRAERRAGEILDADPDLGPGKTARLAVLGLNAQQSSRWQRIAQVPEPTFERYIADALEHHKEITTSAALKLADQRPENGGLKRKRRPLPVVAEQAGWDFRKATERLERIVADDRFASNKEQVAAHLSGHLSYAIEVCRDLLAQLSQEGATK